MPLRKLPSWLPQWSLADLLIVAALVPVAAWVVSWSMWTPQERWVLAVPMVGAMAGLAVARWFRCQEYFDANPIQYDRFLPQLNYTAPWLTLL